MTMQPILESGMQFGPYPDGKCFYIEKSKTYASVQQRVQIAEFLLLRVQPTRPPVVWVIEAKSSSPKPETQPNFDGFISEIRNKWINAFSLGWAACLKRHASAFEELPDAFKMLDLSKADVRFVLVINGYPKEWLVPLQDALRIELYATIKTWAFSPTAVAVINNESAVELGLISES